MCFCPCSKPQWWFYPLFLNFVILPSSFSNEAAVYPWSTRFCPCFDHFLSWFCPCFVKSKGKITKFQKWGQSHHFASKQGRNTFCPIIILINNILTNPNSRSRRTCLDSLLMQNLNWWFSWFHTTMQSSGTESCRKLIDVLVIGGAPADY